MSQTSQEWKSPFHRVDLATPPRHWSCCDAEDCLMGQNALTTRVLQPLVLLNVTGGAQGEYEGFGIAEVLLRLYLLWSLLVATRLPRGARRTRCSVGCPDHCGAWTDKADADRYPPSFLPA